MDYRSIDIARLTWVGTSVWYGAGKVEFQTPPSRFTLTSCPRICLGACELLLHSLPADFVAFVTAVQDTITLPPKDDRRIIDAVQWPGQMRLTVYEGDTLWFDVNGKQCPPSSFLGDKELTKVCCCLLAVTGAWASASSIGLKILVKEVKVVAKPPVSSGWMFTEEESA